MNHADTESLVDIKRRVKRNLANLPASNHNLTALELMGENIITNIGSIHVVSRILYKMN